MRADVNHCDTCVFHDPAPQPGRDGAGAPVSVGFCMRYPPQITPTGSAYPVVGSGTNWCGEYVVSPATIDPRPTSTKTGKRGKS